LVGVEFYAALDTILVILEAGGATKKTKNRMKIYNIAGKWPTFNG